MRPARQRADDTRPRCRASSTAHTGDQKCQLIRTAGGSRYGASPSSRSRWWHVRTRAHRVAPRRFKWEPERVTSRRHVIPTLQPATRRHSWGRGWTAKGSRCATRALILRAAAVEHRTERVRDRRSAGGLPAQRTHPRDLRDRADRIHAVGGDAALPGRAALPQPPADDRRAAAQHSQRERGVPRSAQSHHHEPATAPSTSACSTRRCGIRSSRRLRSRPCGGCRQRFRVRSAGTTRRTSSSSSTPVPRRRSRSLWASRRRRFARPVAQEGPLIAA